MAEIAHRTLHTNGLSMHLAEAGVGPLVVLAHGFPELWYSWRHQLQPLADAGYHVVAPDQRGYGRTDAPPRIEDYDIANLTGDLVGILDAFDEERAVFVGHDWGAIAVWALALVAPERVRGLAALSVPYTPRPPMPPTDLFRAFSGDRFFYILYFQEPGPADRELAANPRRAMVRILYSLSGDAPDHTIKRLPKEGTGYLDIMGDPPGLPSWLSEEDLDVYATEFARTGFTGPLNWYRNFDRNWELMEAYSGSKVEQPALYVAGDRDVVLKLIPADVMEGWVADLRGTVMIPGAGHWVQQERPDAVNRALLEFLSGLG